ncbi:hypothetical protein L209DRAFT_423971 [Thermothelomyces heterothallicus CBS 203.75]
MLCQAHGSVAALVYTTVHRDAVCPLRERAYVARGNFPRHARADGQADNGGGESTRQPLSNSKRATCSPQCSSTRPTATGTRPPDPQSPRAPEQAKGMWPWRLESRAALGVIGREVPGSGLRARFPPQARKEAIWDAAACVESAGATAIARAGVNEKQKRRNVLVTLMDGPYVWYSAGMEVCNRTVLYMYRCGTPFGAVNVVF